MRPRALSLLMLALAGCEFTVADWYYVDGVRVMGTRAKVVEFGVWPQRIGIDPLDTDVTEPMPGDRLRLEAMVVDGGGLPIDPGDLDALWFQCGPDRCVRDTELIAGLDRACSDVEALTMDEACMLGEGGSIEFEVPPVGPQTLEFRYGYYYMVAGVPGQRSAAECWTARQAERESLEGCLFADRELKVGPSWLLLADAALAGLESDIPLYEIPAGAFLQLSNRVPARPTVTVQRKQGIDVLDADGPPLRVTAGEPMSLALPQYRDADFQVYFLGIPTVTPNTYVFVSRFESIWHEWYTTGSIARTDDGTYQGVAEIVIDERAEPGSISRLLLLWGDDRGALDLAVFEFEVEG